MLSCDFFKLPNRHAGWYLEVGKEKTCELYQFFFKLWSECSTDWEKLQEGTKGNFGNKAVRRHVVKMAVGLAKEHKK